MATKGEDAPPENSVEFVKQKLKDNFNVVPESIQPLKGHADKNFLVKTDDEKFVFKLKNSCVDELRSQISFMVFLYGKGFVTPTIIPTSNGRLYCQEGDLLMCMMTFLDGVELYDLEDEDLGIEKLYEVGQLLAEMHLASETMDQKNLSAMAGLDQDSEWNMENAILWKKHLEYIELDHRLLSDKVITELQLLLPSLKNENRGIMHSDFHDSNIIHLNHPLNNTPKGKYGIIDFGDTVASLYLFDVAITVAYFMMISNIDDFLDRGAHVLAGYLSKSSLSALEKKGFFTCVCAAYCRELVLCNKDYHIQGGRNEYLMTSMSTGWPQLNKLWNDCVEFHTVFEKVLSIDE